MLSRLTGTLIAVHDETAELSLGPVTLEVLLPAADVEPLREKLHTPINLNTLLYFEGDTGGGNSIPRLIGFQNTRDKRVFEKLITVKGVGPKKALRMLAIPATEVASAIERRDVKTLTQLPTVGKRGAEQIIAELAGKLTDLAGEAALVETKATIGRRTSAEQDAIDTLISLGERVVDAERLLDQARGEGDGSTEALVRVMLSMRGRR